MKVLILFFAITWYLTCKHWWRPVILITIILELFKLVSVFSPNRNKIDEIEYFLSMPITVPLIIILILFSFKLNKLRLSYDVRNSLDEEIDEVFFQLNQDKFDELNTMKKKTQKIKDDYYNIDKETYVKELISIRDQFYKL